MIVPADLTLADKLLYLSVLERECQSEVDLSDTRVTYLHVQIQAKAVCGQWGCLWRQAGLMINYVLKALISVLMTIFPHKKSFISGIFLGSHVEVLGLSGQDQAAVVLHTDHFPRLLFIFLHIYIVMYFLYLIFLFFSQ